MIRTFAMIAALATASVAIPASAQSYGGITLSFGSGGYADYDHDEDYRAYDRGAYDGYYADPRYGSGYSYTYDNPNYAWQAHERAEQVQRWRQEQERRHWKQERREHSRSWRNDDDQ